MQDRARLTAAVALWCAMALASASRIAIAASDAATRRACERVAALGPEGLKAVMLAIDDGEIIVDIDGDKVDEHLSWRWDLSSMRPRIWFVQNAKGESYLKDDPRNGFFEDEPGAIEPGAGYELVWIKLDGNIFALGMYDERHVIATDLTRFSRGEGKLLCTFDHTATVEWTPATDRDEQICGAANAGKATNLSFKPTLVDWQKGLRATMTEIQGAGTAETDLDRDGKPDALVRWEFQSGAGRGCRLDWLDAHPNQPNTALRKALLDAQGFQMDPGAGGYDHYSQMLPRDELGSRCGDLNEIVHIEGRPYVNANDRLTSLEGRGTRLVCQGKKTTRWRVKKYAE